MAKKTARQKAVPTILELAGLAAAGYAFLQIDAESTFLYWVKAITLVLLGLLAFLRAVARLRDWEEP